MGENIPQFNMGEIIAYDRDVTRCFETSVAHLKHCIIQRQRTDEACLN